MTEPTAPRIYVASLSDYNAGELHGVWIDVDGKDADDIQEEVATMLRASKHPNVMVDHPVTMKRVPTAEEWAIHDHEGFYGLIGEYTSFDDVAAIAAAVQSDDDTRIGLVWLVRDRGSTLTDALEQCDEVRTFTSDKHDLVGDYAEELADDIIGSNDERMNQWPFTCIDWERAGRELVLGGDIDEFELDGTRYIITNASEF